MKLSELKKNKEKYIYDITYKLKVIGYKIIDYKNYLFKRILYIIPLFLIPFIVSLITDNLFKNSKPIKLFLRNSSNYATITYSQILFIGSHFLYMLVMAILCRNKEMKRLFTFASILAVVIFGAFFLLNFT